MMSSFGLSPENSHRHELPAWFDTGFKPLNGVTGPHDSEAASLRQGWSSTPREEDFPRHIDAHDAPELRLAETELPVAPQHHAERQPASSTLPELRVAETEQQVVPEFNTAAEAEQALVARYVPGTELSPEGGQIAVSKEDGSVVAIKRFSKHDSTEAAEVRRQIKLLWDIPHSIIPEMREWLESDLTLWLVTDYRPRQSLRQLITASGPVPNDGAKDVMTQLFAGLAHLFLHHVAPMRISDDNLFFDAKSHLVIHDFSSAFEYSHQKEDQRYAAITGKYGSDIYVAPEVFEGGAYNARKAILWSCGVVLYYMITGQTERLSSLDHPASRDGPTPQRRFSLASKIPKDVPKIISYPNRLRVPRWSIDIISKMLIFDPYRRPELIEVASKVPKMQVMHAARPLMELAYLDYKQNVGPVGPGLDLRLGNASSASSVFSTNTMTGLLGNFRNRAASSAW